MNNAIGTEFKIYSSAAQILDGAATVGLNFTKGDSTAEIQNALLNVTSLLTNYTANASDVSVTATQVLSSTKTFLPVGFYSSVGFGSFGFLLLLLGFIIIIVAVNQSKNTMRCGVKLCLVLVALFSFLIVVQSCKIGPSVYVINVHA